MPSCSFKIQVLHENDFSDSINNVDFYKKAVSRASTRSVHRFLFNNVPDEIYPRCAKLSNSSQDCDIWTLCQVLVNNTVNVKPFKIKLHVLLTFKCEVEREYLIKQTNSLVVLELLSQNVIKSLIIYFWLKLLLHFSLTKSLELGRSFKQALVNENKFRIVMEVDDMNIHVNNLPKGDQINSSDAEKSDGYSAVINKNQIMIKSEFPKNNFIHENNVDVKVKEEVQENNELMTNGDIKCYEESKESVDLIQVSQTKVFHDGAVKDNVNGDDKIGSCIPEPKERKPNDVVHDQEIKVEEKIAESKDVKNPSRGKDQCVNNHVSSSKKYDSQSGCHQSSRHKYKDVKDKHKSSSSSSSSSSSKTNEASSSSSRKEDSKSSSYSRSRSRSCHHKPDEKCHCRSRHHSHHHSKKSKKYQSVKTQCTADEIAFELRQNKVDPSNPYFTRVPWVPHPQLANLKYGKFMRIEVDRNGGASVCHLYMDEISHLTEAQLKECALEFIKLSYSEDENECAYHVMGIVHGAASYLPDLVDYMADHYPTLIVKTGSLASRDNHTTTMSQYRDEVYKTYSNGTFRFAPLDQLSICGVLGEEVGAYFPDFVARLEQSPFMKAVMPWSSLSVVETDNPRESNDGPIFWVRPGEQMLPANEALKESARPKKRRNNELDNLAYIGGSRSSEARESLFQDRTKAHADQVGVDYGISNTAPTAAVGVLKAVNCGHPEHGNRATKDVVAFHAQDYSELLEILMLDLYEPPQTQCTKWIEVSKLNTLRREGIRYAHLQLHDNDVYYLPRKIIHQFQTISSVASVAWHIRYKDYFSILGAPNLHTPTGINKGQVFYEKKNVAVYCPPVNENDLLAAVQNGEATQKTPKKVDRLKEYSPFKHSPRKMHKYQSKKHAASLPPQSTGTVKNEPRTPNAKHETEMPNPIKKEPVTPNSVKSESNEEKKSNFSKKRERSKSDDRSSPRRDESRRNSEKSESSQSRRSSEEVTPSKKERKSEERHSSKRKEKKNLNCEFSSKKKKSNRDKSPKLREGKRSDDSKHRSGSSKQRRHDEDRSKRDHGESSHKVKTEEKGEKEGGSKRKRDESPSHSCPKKMKGEVPDARVSEVGSKTPKREQDTSSEGQPVTNSDCALVKKEIVAECVKEGEEETRVGGTTPSDVNTSENERKEPEEKLVNIPAETKVHDKEFDLRPRSFASYMNQVSPFPPPLPPPPPPPPPPPSSPPTNPPPPPPSPPVHPPPPFPSPVSLSPRPFSPTGNPPPPLRSSPIEDSPVRNFDSSPSKPSSLQDTCTFSKEKSDSHMRKVKKKIFKKTNESYDLLGDIMSKMDKK